MCAHAWGEGEPDAVNNMVNDAEGAGVEVEGFDTTGVEVQEVTMPADVCARWG